MNLIEFERFRDLAGDAGLIYYYAGHFDEEVRRSLSANLKNRLEQAGIEGAVRRRLFSSFMEMAQNVLHYGGCVEAGGPAAARPGAIAIGKDDASYWVVCGNLVPLEHVPRIAARLDRLREMSLEEIRLAYREQLANDEHELLDAVSKGAGLGFLTIARDSAQPIEYEFSDDARGSPFARFHLKTFV